MDKRQEGTAVILLDFKGEIKGTSQLEGYEEWIKCKSMEFAVERSISRSGGGRDRDTSNPAFTDILLAKRTDASSTALLEQSCGGRSPDRATIALLKTGRGDGPFRYLTIELDHPIISSFAIDTDGKRPHETIRLNFERITFRYDLLGRDGRVVRGQDFTWDLATNKKV